MLYHRRTASLHFLATRDCKELNLTCFNFDNHLCPSRDCAMNIGVGPPNYTKPFRAKAVVISCRSRWSLPDRSRVFIIPTAANTTSPAPSSNRSAALGIPVPPLPDAVSRSLAAARRSWLDRCLDNPFVDTTTNSRVYVYGTAHFAPLGGAQGLAELQELLNAVQPNILAIEQPYDVSARAGLPYPEVIRLLTGLFPDEALRLAGCQGLPEAGSGPQHSTLGHVAAATAAGASAATDSALGTPDEQQLRSVLPGLAEAARVGRDLLDPFEVFGLYGGCDYVTRPAQMVEALSQFGYLPGLEYAALAVAAEQRSVQVCSVDAPLRLQEKWVAQLVSEFTLGEADLTRRLQHDLDQAQSLLPPEYLAWDVELAEAVRRTEEDRQQAEAVQRKGGAAAAAATGEPSLRTITAFKVSRAVAAATLHYDVSKRGFALQAALQPLKFALFARKAKHLVLQIRDLCQRISVRQVRVDAAKLHGATAAAAGVTDRAAAAEPALVDVSGQPEKVVLAVVGRQYMPYIEELWANERSVLWHGDVPRTFAASTLQQRWQP